MNARLVSRRHTVSRSKDLVAAKSASAHQHILTTKANVGSNRCSFEHVRLLSSCSPRTILWSESVRGVLESLQQDLDGGVHLAAATLFCVEWSKLSKFDRHSGQLQATALPPGPVLRRGLGSGQDIMGAKSSCGCCTHWLHAFPLAPVLVVFQSGSLCTRVRWRRLLVALTAVCAAQPLRAYRGRRKHEGPQANRNSKFPIFDIKSANPGAQSAQKPRPWGHTPVVTSRANRGPRRSR
jgi:hypothetical protein